MTLELWYTHNITMIQECFAIKDFAEGYRVRTRIVVEILITFHSKFEF